MTAKVYMVRCQHDGCTNTDNVQEWSIYGYDPEPIFFFCTDHAAEFGFCVFCGHFIGGLEDCFLTGQHGLCLDCFLDMEGELDREYFNDEDDEWG